MAKRWSSLVSSLLLLGGLLTNHIIVVPNAILGHKVHEEAYSVTMDVKLPSGETMTKSE